MKLDSLRYVDPESKKYHPFWDGVGKYPLKAVTIDAALIEAGITWEVKSAAATVVFTPNIIEGEITERLPNRVVLYRSDTNRVLGIVPSYYRYPSPSVGLNVVEHIIDAFDGSLVTVGAIDKGSRVFAIARLSEDIPFSLHTLVEVLYDRLKGIRVDLMWVYRSTAVPLFPKRTQRAILYSYSQRPKNPEERIQLVNRKIEVYRKRSLEDIDFLQNTKLKEERFTVLLNLLLEKNREIKNPTTRINMRLSVRERLETLKNSFGDTLLSCYLAFCQYTDFHKAIRAQLGANSGDSRFLAISEKRGFLLKYRVWLEMMRPYK